jgi:hypothetical protein
VSTPLQKRGISLKTPKMIAKGRTARLAEIPYVITHE